MGRSRARRAGSLVYGAGRHTRRSSHAGVHIHTERLARELGWDELDARLALKAALVHDIGRRDDGGDPRHGARSVTRAVKLGLTTDLSPDDLEILIFAVKNHCLRDSVGEQRAAETTDPARALRVLWLLKDADALDRLRLGDPPDPAQLRSPQAVESIGFAWELLAALPDPAAAVVAPASVAFVPTAPATDDPAETGQVGQLYKVLMCDEDGLYSPFSETGRSA